MIFFLRNENDTFLKSLGSLAWIIGLYKFGENRKKGHISMETTRLVNETNNLIKQAIPKNDVKI